LTCGFGVRAREGGKRGETVAANCIRFAAQSGWPLVTEKLPFRNNDGAEKRPPGVKPLFLHSIAEAAGARESRPSKSTNPFYTKSAKATKIDPRQTSEF
jgi:hypothetical protein